MPTSQSTSDLSANQSPYGWWVATLILRFQYVGEDVSNPRHRCMADENLVLIKAKDREEAYRKALRLGEAEEDVELSDSTTGRRGYFVFEGLSSLLPVYDEIEDGAELLWTRHSNITVGRVQSWVRDKSGLKVFQDDGSVSVTRGKIDRFE